IIYRSKRPNRLLPRKYKPLEKKYRKKGKEKRSNKNKRVKNDN
ncbi:unnamed protein product, partial [marine sediment metagenome]